MRTIQEAIKEHLNATKEYGIEPNHLLGVFVYGSQNYGVDLPTSDVDTKAIYIPTWREAVLKRTKPNHVVELENGEHCEIMDIRHFVDNLKKQNINFVEVLFTEHFYLNPYFADTWLKGFIAHNERIAHYDIAKAVASISGQAIHTIKQNPLNGKKIANAWRLCYFLDEYLAGAPYKACLVPDNKSREMMKILKQMEQVQNDCMSLQLISDFEDIQREFADGKYDYIPENKQFLDNLLDDLVMELMRGANIDEW